MKMFRCVRFGLLAVFLTTLTEAETAQFRFERQLLPAGSGPNRTAPDVTLLAGVAYADLRDLRLFDSSGKETPFLLMPPPRIEPRWATGRILMVAETKEASGFEVDLGGAVRVDRLRLGGLRTPFLKRFQLEGSGDRSHWTLLTREGTLFHLPDENLQLTEATFEAGEYRYLRVTWDDRQSGRISPPESVSARIAQTRAVAESLRIQAEFRPLASSPGRSRFQIRLPGPHLPLAAIHIGVKETRLLRTARVTESVLSGSEAHQQELGRATLRRVSQDNLTAEDLRIPIRPPAGREIEIVVDDASNPSLDLARVDLVFAPQPWIYFESASGQPLTAKFGNSGLAAPHYDLEAMRQFVNRTEPKSAFWGDIRLFESGGKTADSSLDAAGMGSGGDIDTKPFRHSRRIPESAPGLSALVLDTHVLAHSRLDLSDIRIAVDTVEGMRQIPYLLERFDDTFSLDLPMKAGSAPDTSSKKSRYILTLPYDNLPAGRLSLTTTERVFQRNVSVQSTERKTKGSDTLAATTWRHDDPETPAPPVTLELRSGLRTETIDVIVDEGDNRPLPVTSARLDLQLYRLRFFYPAQGRVSLLYGSPTLSPPRYDLALLAPRLIGLSSQEIRLVPESVTGTSSDDGSYDTRIFWGALAGAVLVILLVLARLLRAQPAQE